MPIIIDDTIICVCIIGIKKIFTENEETIYRLLIADPHVGKEMDIRAGVYIVEVNEKGQFVREINKYSKMNGKRLRFDVMEFMVYIADDISE